MSTIENLNNEHASAIGACAAIQQATATADEKLRALTAQLEAVRADEADARADELLAGGTATKAKASPAIAKIEGEIYDQRAILAALRRRHVAASATERNARLMLRRAERESAGRTAELSANEVRRLESELATERQRGAAAETEARRLDGLIKNLEGEARERIAFEQGSPGELAELAADPTIAIARTALDAELKKLSDGWLAERHDGDRVLVRAKKAGIYWDRQTGDVLATDVVAIEAVTGGFVGDVPLAHAGYSYDPERRRREIAIDRGIAGTEGSKTNAE